MTAKITWLSVIVLLIAAALVAAAYSPSSARAQSGTPITGYAWSDNIGWISLNCATGSSSGTSICSTSSYGLSVDTGGNVTGYAWSDNIGWISANPSDLSGCPSGPCTATMQNGHMMGWMKALSADNNGWDGWISLSGSSPSYGPTLSGNSFTGYAWGSNVVGWIDFEYAGYTRCTQNWQCTGSNGQTITQTNTDCTQQTVATCVPPGQYCENGANSCQITQISANPSGNYTGNLQVVPNIVLSGGTVHVFWNISGATGCSVVGTNGDGSGKNSTGTWNTLTSPSGGETSSAITTATTYTLSCTGYSGATPPSIGQSVQVQLSPQYEEI